MSKIKNLLRLLLIMLVSVSIISTNLEKVSAGTNQIKGVNWADPADNFKSGILYVSGLSSSDSYSSAATVADRVIGQFMSLSGSNCVRMPINEATVSSYWSTYTGAIDTALNKGKVILGYWAASNGKPADLTAYWNMWTTVVNKYGSNANCYFEPINEPYGYTNATDLCNLYNNWITKFSSVSQGRVILDGTGYAEDVKPVGSDSRLSNCLLGVHNYSYWSSYSSEGSWQNSLSNQVGSYAGRVVMTEWGAPMTTGKNYNSTSTDNEICYIRGISNQLRGSGMGSVYWPGLRDGDSYSLTTKSGSGSSISLTVNNSSGLQRLKYAWGDINIKIKNVGTGLYLDGLGYTSNGSNVGQWSSSTSYNQQWVIEGQGSYVRIKNASTGLYLDGLGNTSNGSNVGQWSKSNSSNQLWVQENYGNNVRFKNAATGLYIDSFGNTANGSNIGQWSSSGSTNQQWQLVVP